MGWTPITASRQARRWSPTWSLSSPARWTFVPMSMPSFGSHGTYSLSFANKRRGHRLRWWAETLSPSRGGEGIEVAAGRPLLVADDPTSFASAVISLINDPNRRRELGLAARALAVSKHDWGQVTPLLGRGYGG